MQANTHGIRLQILLRDKAYGYNQHKRQTNQKQITDE